MHWTHYLPTMKTNEWRRAHHLKLSKTPVCASKDFYKRRWLCQTIFVTDWFSRVHVSSSNCTLLLWTQTCGVQSTAYNSQGPMESESSIDFWQIYYLQKKKRRITVSLSQRRTAQNPESSGKTYCHFCNKFDFSGLKVWIESRKQNMFNHCMFTYFKADSLLWIFMHLYI